MRTHEDPQNDALWLALERAKRALEHDPSVLTRNRLEYPDGLNAAQINRLAVAAGLCAVGPPLAERHDGDNARYLVVHDPNRNDPLTVDTWDQDFPVVIGDRAVHAIIERLDAWQDKRRRQLLLEGNC